MRIFRNTSLQINAPAGPNNRRHGRVRCVCIRCYLPEFDGEEAKVLDFSASGLRLQLEKKKHVGIADGATINILLVSPGGTVELPAKVVWCRRSGYRRFEFGATFGPTTDELRKKLSPVMRAATDNYVVYNAPETL
jgi:hypothetical protein